MVWTSRPSLDDRFYSSAVSDGNIAIFAGGLSMSTTPSSILDGFSVSDAYEIYDSQTDSWTTGNLSPGGARAKISACHCNGYFVFAGGVVADEVGSPRVDIFDGSNWTNQNMVNGTRTVESCATAGDKILFAGGLQHDLSFHHGGSNITSRIDIFNSQNQSFSYSSLTRPLMDFRMAGYGRTAAASPGVSFPAGNYTAYNEVQVYQDNSWINAVNEDHNINVSVFPNPTTQIITISVNNYNGNIQTEVFDLIGNKLQTTNETIISLRDYSKGIYILKVTYGDKSEEVKVIKD
jgi:hypothetical protein